MKMERKRMEERLNRIEGRSGGGKKKKAEDSDWIEWQSWNSEGSSDSSKYQEETKKRRLKSEVRKGASLDGLEAEAVTEQRGAAISWKDTRVKCS